MGVLCLAGQLRGGRVPGMDLLADAGRAGDQRANLALEEALARSGLSRPLISIWQNECCLVLGRAQQASREVDLAACAAAGVPVLRRASGGGTVYQDLGNLNITLAVPGSAPGLAADLTALVAAVVAGFGLAVVTGARGVFAGPAGNADAALAKVSGLAAQLTRTGSVAHATLLVTTPVVRVTRFLAPAPAGSRPTDSHRSPVSALAGLGCGISVAAARGAVLAEAARRYGPLSPRPLSDGERRWHDRLLAHRYTSSAWHLTGRTEEEQWTRRPVLTCTG